MPNSADFLIILLAELNLLEIRYYAFFLDTLRDNRISSVDAPRNEDLGCCCAQLFCDFLDDGVVRELGLVKN